MGKNLFRISIDITLLGLAFVLATLIRLEGLLDTPTDHFIWEKQLIILAPLVVLVQAIVLTAFGTYKRFWRYTSVTEIIHLSQSLFLASLITIVPRFLGANPHNQNILAVSYGVLVIDFLLALGFLSAIRLLRAYLVEQRNIKRRLVNLEGTQKRTLIIGAGEAGLEVIKSIMQHPELGLKIVGVLDDDTRKHKMNLANGVSVAGSINDVKYWVSELNVDQIIIAIPSLKQKEIKRISLLCSDTGAELRIVPGVDQLAGGQVSIETIRRLSMEDLLGRDTVDLSSAEVLSFLQDKRVLVTGAGGSIGKELCVQLVKNCGIKSLCLVGKGENSIFDTANEVSTLGSSLEKRIADIRNYSRMEAIFNEFQPEVVFHAAAHKHVHLMELNPCEAFENNVIGTRNIAELSGKYQVQAFVLISTDKAVNPTSIMGTTKNLAEKAVLTTSRRYPQTKYTAVRFGNVLGSRGSVIKVWEKQLQEGKAITVTHRDAFRYFMTIPEAAQLVIQAAAKASSGEIMVLDMGQPVKIYELARQFIQLSGFNTEDVEIQVTGLKEGEKLHEELLTAGEFVDTKLTEKIYRAKIDPNLNIPEFEESLIELMQLAKDNKVNELKTQLRYCLKSRHSEERSKPVQSIT